MASYLYIENGAKIKPQSGSNYVADASNISGLYNGQTKDLAYIIEQLESRIANASFTPTLDSGEQKLLWFNGSVPSSITNGSTGTLTKGRCFAKYGDYYKEVTSSTNLTFKASAGSISGTTITPPTVSSGTQSVNVWAEYKEGTITQTSSSKSYTAKANVSYYWYVGTSMPSSVDTANIQSSVAEIGWHNMNASASTLSVGQCVADTSSIWYVCIPVINNSAFTKVLSGGIDVTAGFNVSTETISGVSYKVFVKPDISKKFKYDFSK